MQWSRSSILSSVKFLKSALPPSWGKLFWWLVSTTSFFQSTLFHDRRWEFIFYSVRHTPKWSGQVHPQYNSRQQTKPPVYLSFDIPITQKPRIQDKTPTKNCGLRPGGAEQETEFHNNTERKPSILLHSMLLLFPSKIHKYFIFYI